MTDTQRNADSFGANAWLVDDMYEQYRQDPLSVSESWRDFFEDYRPGGANLARPSSPEVTPPDRIGRRGASGAPEPDPASSVAATRPAIPGAVEAVVAGPPPTAEAPAPAAGPAGLRPSAAAPSGPAAVPAARATSPDARSRRPRHAQPRPPPRCGGRPAASSPT